MSGYLPMHAKPFLVMFTHCITIYSLVSKYSLWKLPCNCTCMHAMGHPDLVHSMQCAWTHTRIHIQTVFELPGGWGVEPPTSPCRPPYLWSKFDPGGVEFQPPT